MANVVVEVSKIGYYTVTNEITLTNAANQPFTMATTMTLPVSVSCSYPSLEERVKCVSFSLC